MTKLYLYSRKIHRVMMSILIILALFMSFTGAYLKYPWLRKVVPLDTLFLRNIHNQLSPFFTIALTVMAITGIVMYIIPLLKRT
jgi:hypothetical protein